MAERRREFAQTIVAAAGPQSGPSTSGAEREHLAAAFAAVPREAFLGPPPWRMHGEVHGGRTRLLYSPEQVYQDQTIALLPERGINNGQPSLHARCLAALHLQPGETVAHVGAGTGYYTAVVAELVGERGRVEAFEVEPVLAQQAAANLARYRQVEVHARSGAVPPFPESDVIYVNAGLSCPLPVWLEGLRPYGRLLFPLTGEEGAGAMLLITKGAGPPPWRARFLDPVVFISCAETSRGCGRTGAEQAVAELRLTQAFERGGLDRVRSLHRRESVPDDSAWLAGDGWWLSTVPP